MYIPDLPLGRGRAKPYVYQGMTFLSSKSLNKIIEELLCYNKLNGGILKRYIYTIKTLLSFANDRKLGILQLFLSEFLSCLTALLPPIATAGIIGIITENDFNGIWFYVTLYVIFFIAYFLCVAWNHASYRDLSSYYQHTVQQLLINHITNNEAIFDKISRGKIIATCTEDVRFMVDVLETASNATAAFAQLIFIFFAFLIYSPFVAIIATAIDAAYLILMNHNAHYVARHYEGTRKYEDKTADLLTQMLSNLKQVKSLNLMPNLNKKIERSKSEWVEQYRRKYKYYFTRYAKLPFIVYGGKILLYVLLGYMVVNGQITIDRLVLLISYFEMSITYSDTILENLLNLSSYGVRVQRVKNILDYTGDSAIDYGDIENDYISGSVTFDNVYYDVKGKTILNNVSFKVYPNEITAIVGKPGSGKTTIVNLLYRLHRVKSGSILLDDESIYNYSEKIYSSNISGVFQKSLIFKMSIKDNLSLIDSNADHQVSACKRVGVHKAIKALPKGYDTIIDAENSLLTDGETQKLALARALLSKAEVLLLDEVTSNIDPASTADVAELLKDLKEDHTIIIATHKPELMEISDRVVVLKEGKISAKGTNKEVYQKSKLYQSLRSATFTGPSELVEDDV